MSERDSTEYRSMVRRRALEIVRESPGLDMLTLVDAIKEEGLEWGPVVHLFGQQILRMDWTGAVHLREEGVND
jgi:hypothetical protein